MNIKYWLLKIQLILQARAHLVTPAPLSTRWWWRIHQTPNHYQSAELQRLSPLPHLQLTSILLHYQGAISRTIHPHKKWRRFFANCGNVQQNWLSSITNNFNGIICCSPLRTLYIIPPPADPNNPVQSSTYYLCLPSCLTYVCTFISKTSNVLAALSPTIDPWPPTVCVINEINIYNLPQPLTSFIPELCVPLRICRFSYPERDRLWPKMTWSTQITSYLPPLSRTPPLQVAIS